MASSTRNPPKAMQRGSPLSRPSPGTAVAGDVVFLAGVANRQLPAAAATAHEAGEQRVAVLGHAMVAARGDVVADHPTYRLRTLPVDIALVYAGLQRQPFGARLAPAPRARPRGIIACLHGRPAIGIRAA